MRLGYEVTLFASGDSQTLARLVAIHPQALPLDSNVQEYAVCEMLEKSQTDQQAAEFGIIHSHVEIGALPLASLVTTPSVHNLHSNFTKDNVNVYSRHQKQAYISISHTQRQINLNYLAIVGNGILLADYPLMPQN
ncbi:hypothetical protein H6G74_26405 [Nostoc spongiaeforme FACHB-130]|uniref:Uncharacterized protein n=1 Tax=Nostoc spongiaeforme FACHB-130 TaxID=1357510 RepID=A0ABR8G3K6_9NOSO|nr:hypothetical protein [Nostoc spongiaeforme FACHB-130]